MIAKDQPTIFGSKIVAGISSVGDGNMKEAGMPLELVKGVDSNRRSFLENLGIRPEQTILVRVTYDKDDFTVYETVKSEDSGKGITRGGEPFVDALATNEKNVALFLPLADCVGAILYDPVRSALMVSHLGRHSTEQHGATMSVNYMVKQFACNPKDIVVWCSPSPGKESYPLFAFENRSLAEVSTQHLIDAGILRKNIEIAVSDTSTDENYFSHSQFLKDSSQPNGRFAIVAMIN